MSFRSLAAASARKRIKWQSIKDLGTDRRAICGDARTLLAANSVLGLTLRNGEFEGQESTWLQWCDCEGRSFRIELFNEGNLNYELPKLHHN